MSLRTIVVLLIILAVLVGVAVWQGGRRPEAAGAAPGAPVLPDLDVNAIHRIEISAAGSTAVVERLEGRWVVPTRYGYSADFDKVVEALRGLSELEIGQVIRDADQYPAEFGLADDSPAVRVALHGAAENPVTLTLGGAKQEGGRDGFPGYDTGRYLRTPAGAVALVGDPLRDWTAASDDWIRKNLLSLPADEIEQISVSVSNTEYTLLVKGAGQFEVAGAAEGEAAEPGAASRLEKAFQYLRCETVVDPAAEAIQSFEVLAQCVVRTRDRREYTLQVGGPAPDGGRYLRIGAAYIEPSEPTEEDGAAARKAVKEQTAAWKDWTFVVPGHVAETLTLPRESVVKKATAPEKPGEE
ncbi:MAG: DUF4340 domain-containing protein [Kiritimatiellae bacterium]|nr:DUF4340 domain-containing protein [Kiritimatiellia bacterium]